jgi:hypothetical protein
VETEAREDKLLIHAHIAGSSGSSLNRGLGLKVRVFSYTGTAETETRTSL